MPTDAPLSLAGIDTALFYAINSGAFPFLDRFFILLSNRLLGVAVLVATLLFIFIKYRVNFVRTAFAAGLAVGLSDLFGSLVLKPFFDRVRPCYALPAETIRQLVNVSHSGSMPSLHASDAFAAAFALTFYNRRLGYVAYPIAALVAVGRVYVGVHWPFDALAGALWGTLAGWLAVLAVNKIAGRFADRPLPPG